MRFSYLLKEASSLILDRLNDQTGLCDFDPFLSSVMKEALSFRSISIGWDDLCTVLFLTGLSNVTSKIQNGFL